MVVKSGRKPKPAKDTIIKLKASGKSTSAIIAELGIRDSKGKDYVYHVISEARNRGLVKDPPLGGSSVPAPAPTGSGGLIIEEAPVAEEAHEVSGMYSDSENGGLPKANLPIISQFKPAASASEEIPTDSIPENPLAPVDEGTEIDLSDITELPIEIEDRIFKRRHLEPLTEQEKENIRNHGKVMIDKRIKIKHPLGDIINYSKAVIKPVLTRVVGRKFTKDVEQTEAEETDAMKEYERLQKKKAEGE